MKTKFSMLATFLMTAIPLAGCSSSYVPHGGLVPEISGDTTVIAGQAESYDFDASSANGYRLAYGVNWGDGSKPLFAPNISSSSSVSGDHAWAQPGTYTITATVTDGHGESGYSIYTVQVNPAPPPEP